MNSSAQPSVGSGGGKLTEKQFHSPVSSLIHSALTSSATPHDLAGGPWKTTKAECKCSEYSRTERLDLYSTFILEKLFGQTKVYQKKSVEKEETTSHSKIITPSYMCGQWDGVIGLLVELFH